jgi:hypothetical protein
MVIKRLQQVGFIFLLTLVSNVSHSASQLILFTDKTESVIGRPIRADLYGISLNSKISDINLSKLNENFGIMTDYVINDTSDKRWPNKAIQILRLKLYPRRTGKIIIPPLSSNNVYSEEKILHITDGNTDTPKIKLSTTEPYERQQIIVQFSIISNDSTSRLSLSENIDISGFESQSLPFKRTQNKDGKYLLQIGLALSALRSGLLKLELPAIEYSVSGVSRKQFYFPTKKVTVKPLPLYLPPTIPVGRISIESKSSSTYLIKTDSIYYWNIKLSGELINTYQLPAILRQIKSNSNIKFFPVDSKRSAIKKTSNLTKIVNHSIPFKVFDSGSLKLPAIHFQQFDPVTGKIEKTILQSDDIFALSLLWRSILSIFIISVTSYIINLIYKIWKRFIYSKHMREQAIQILNKEENIGRIRESIRFLAKSEHWPKNITITQFGTSWEEKYQTDDSFQLLIKDLSLCLYNTSQNYNLKSLSVRLLKLINNRKNRKKIYQELFIKK